MEYPAFNPPIIGGSLLIASIAIFHAFIAHFSVGASWMLAVAERRANRESDNDLLALLKKYALVVLLVPYILGAMTGVGIWFATSVVNPRAISAMIHLFVWGWAAEWTMFIVDIVAIYLYVYTWDRIQPAAHNGIAWILAASSTLTLALINGIISFMLTPGSWQALAPYGFWTGFFNPSFWPSTLMRFTVSLALAGAGVLLLMAMSKDLVRSVREKMTRLAYRMMLPSLLCLLIMPWAFSVIPKRSQDFVKGGGIPIAMFFALGMMCFVLLAAGSIAAMLRREYTPTVLGSSLLVLFAFVGYGSFEFVREGVRKPYVIEGFMYSTGVTTDAAAGVDRRANLAMLRKQGVLSAAPWTLPSGKKASELDPLTQGKAVYEAACASCHQTYAGYNALQPLIGGWTQPTIRRFLDTMHEQRPMMPPFPGTDDEKEALTAFIATVTKIGL
ncbi:cytochrome ubiquinol oxidase subunit I [Candidatus Sumerlaeota bacterium]|nr:cytochrome ubiquinol oxidase subunit I [Candidatus Sumerlaeota bacterium]